MYAVKPGERRAEGRVHLALVGHTAADAERLPASPFEIARHRHHLVRAPSRHDDRGTFIDQRSRDRAADTAATARHPCDRLIEGHRRHGPPIALNSSGKVARHCARKLRPFGRDAGLSRRQMDQRHREHGSGREESPHDA